MNKSKVIGLLKSFSRDELKKFSDFLKSPYFNRNETLVRFYTELKKYFPEFEEEKINREKIYHKLFNGKKYNEQVMKNLTSELNKLCKEFLVIEFSKKDIFENKLNLLKQLIPRQADPVFNTELKIFETELKQVSRLSEKNFYYLYQLEDTKISFHLERNEQPLAAEKVLKSGEYLILFFLLNLTKTISNLNVNKQSFNIKYDVNLPQMFFDKTAIEEIIEYMKENNIEFSETAELYFYRIICNTYPFDEKYYYKFRNLLMNHIESLSRIEVYGLFNALETFCLIKISSGNRDFVKELFEVFNLEMEKDFYKFSATSPVTYMKFRNTYLSGLSLKKFEWVESFIESYKNDIIESDRDNVIKIVNSQLDFEKGNYEKALEGIADLKPDNVYSKIDIRNLTVMSYYELNYTEAALSMIDSYKHFVNDNKNISDVFKESHFRFINSLQSLILSKEKNQTDKLHMLKEKLLPFKGEKRISWIIEKIEELLVISY